MDHLEKKEDLHSPAMQKKGKKIVGFHGREGLFLDAIGVHVVDMDIPQWPPNKVEPTPSEHEELKKLMKKYTLFQVYEAFGLSLMDDGL